MPTRRIVQIAAAMETSGAEEEGDPIHGDAILFALASDGTVWAQRPLSDEPEWWEVDALPDAPRCGSLNHIEGRDVACELADGHEAKHWGGGRSW